MNQQENISTLLDIYERFGDNAQKALDFVNKNINEKKTTHAQSTSIVECEDEKIRKMILNLVKKHTVNHERCQMEAYLEKQKEQKSVEWSEEEKYYLYMAIKCAKMHNHPNVANWLESLRPFPKQKWSEKQGDNTVSISNGVYLVCKNGSYSPFDNLTVPPPGEIDKIGIAYDGHYFAVPLNWELGRHKLLNNDEYPKDEHCQSEAEAIMDWDFVKHTKHIQELGTPIPFKDGQYLPTAPVFLAMYKYRDALNSALYYANAERIDFENDYWLAQRHNMDAAWFFNGNYSALYGISISNAHQCMVVSFWKP